MDQNLINILVNIGLNEKEAKVYLALNTVGTEVVSKIAQEAKINRVTTYDILEKLKEKGLVSFFTKKKTKYFSALDPENVLQDFEKKTNDFRTALPKFQKLSGKTSHPRVRYFEGLEGIKAIYAETLNSSTEILNFSNSEEIRKNWPKYDEEYVAKRAKKGIFLRGICPNDNWGQKVKTEDEKYCREIRLLKKDDFNFTNEINIYEDKVSIISFKDELIGMIIESPEIAGSQRAIFNICWQYSTISETYAEIKNRMNTPLSGPELENSIVEYVKSKQQNKKTLEKATKIKKPMATPLEDKSNLSLF